MQHHQSGKIRKAFTLIEMLVVLLIIGILAAILFPVLTSAREKGYQASCATSLHQIYLAVQLYKNDEGDYPGSLAAVLPNTVDLADGNINAGGKGYFKGGKDALICPDDDTDSTGSRSSYGDFGTPAAAAVSGDFGRYIWNYWGYRTVTDSVLPNEGTPATGCEMDDVSKCLGTAYPTDADFQAMITSNNANENPFLQNRFSINPDGTQAADAAITDPAQIDLTKIPRLYNRFAPPSTIITHCVFHRLPTTNVVGNYDLYDTTNSDGQGARDIILKLDGTTKVLDVSTSNFATSDPTTGNAWARQNF